MRSPVHAILLCEDLQLRCFIRRFLLRRGWTARQVREVPLPMSGGGAGIAWLKERLPAEVVAMRDRGSRAATCLIVGCDADDESVPSRIRALKQACEEAGVAAPTDDEPVAFILPKRNIETWLAHLRGEPVNEEQAYRKYEHQADCRDQVAELDDRCRRQALGPGTPPSLALACEQFPRVAQSNRRTS